MQRSSKKKNPAAHIRDGELSRYFIEVQTVFNDAPRWQETELRREQAQNFIDEFNDWLKREALEDKVSAMAITALGQVQITCEADVISQMRHQDEMPIAAIRQAAASMPTLTRFAGR